jgi:hypothetical protein
MVMMVVVLTAQENRREKQQGALAEKIANRGKGMGRGQEGGWVWGMW